MGMICGSPLGKEGCSPMHTYSEVKFCLNKAGFNSTLLYQNILSNNYFTDPKRYWCNKQCFKKVMCILCKRLWLHLSYIYSNMSVFSTYSCSICEHNVHLYVHMSEERCLANMVQSLLLINSHAQMHLYRQIVLLLHNGKSYELKDPVPDS